MLEALSSTLSHSICFISHQVIIRILFISKQMWRNKKAPWLGIEPRFSDLKSDVLTVERSGLCCIFTILLLFTNCFYTDIWKQTIFNYNMDKKNRLMKVHQVMLNFTIFLSSRSKFGILSEPKSFTSQCFTDKDLLWRTISSIFYSN